MYLGIQQSISHTRLARDRVKDDFDQKSQAVEDV